MKNILLLLFVLITAYLLSGCLRTYYPAAYHTSAPPMVLENNSSDQESSKYIKADFSISRGNYDNETAGLFKASYMSAYTRNYTNVNWEAFGYGGMYKVSGLSPSLDGNKNIFGLGTDVNLALNIKADKLKFGIGSNLGLGIEFGEYYSFRRSAYNRGDIGGSDNLVFVFISAYPFINYQFSETTSISTQVNMGIPGMISPSIILNNNDMVYWLSWFPDKENYDFYTYRLAAGVMMNLNSITF